MLWIINFQFFRRMFLNGLLCSISYADMISSMKISYCSQRSTDCHSRRETSNFIFFLSFVMPRLHWLLVIRCSSTFAGTFEWIINFHDCLTMNEWWISLNSMVERGTWCESRELLKRKQFCYADACRFRSYLSNISNKLLMFHFIVYIEVWRL